MLMRKYGGCGSLKDNFYKTPPIPQEGDGMHRIIAAKELGYKTILMWKQI